MEPSDNTNLVPQPQPTEHKNLSVFHALLVGLFVLVVAVFFLFFWYPKYKIAQIDRERFEVSNKSYELSNLLLSSNNCEDVITRAEDFLKTHKSAIEIWGILGACQFDTGKFADSKITFEKVLTLNSDNQSAKVYLDRLQSDTGAVRIVGDGALMSKEEFEGQLGLKFSSDITFNKGVEKMSNVSKYLSGSYSSVKSFSSTVAYIKEELKKSDAKFSLSELPNGVVIAIISSNEQKIISIVKGSLVKINIDYLRLQ